MSTWGNTRSTANAAVSNTESLKVSEIVHVAHGHGYEVTVCNFQDARQQAASAVAGTAAGGKAAGGMLDVPSWRDGRAMARANAQS